MRTRRLNASWLAVLAVVAGLPLVGCDDVLTDDVMRQLNPCLTILNCDPYAWEDLFIDPFGGYQIDIDPTCTIPYRCGTWGLGGPGTGDAGEQGGGGGGGGAAVGGGGLGGAFGGFGT